jgi:dihydropteroate synthase
LSLFLKILLILSIVNFKNTSNQINYTLNCNGKLILVAKPLIMGIINLTPDSFYEKSSVTEITAILKKTSQMVADGVDIIDIGGQSTRPGSTRLTAEEEWARIEIALKEIRKTFPESLISIDTYHSEVAKKAVDAGASIINDISGGQLDHNMITTVGQLKVPYICMHMQGTPETMQQNPAYNDVTKVVLDYFIAKKLECHAAGIHDLIFDVGFGFGKTIEHNYTLLHHLDVFTTILQKPILVGLSRKSMIYKTLGITAEESLNGTTVLNTIALLKGAAILRVHDVREAVEAVKLVYKL